MATKKKTLGSLRKTPLVQPSRKVSSPTNKGSVTTNAPRSRLSEIRRPEGQRAPAQSGQLPQQPPQPPQRGALGFNMQDVKQVGRQLTGQESLPFTGKEFGKAALQGGATAITGIGIAAAGAAAIPSVLVAGRALIGRAATSTTIGSVEKAAAGKLETFGRDALGRTGTSLTGWGKYLPTNTVTEAKSISWLSKIAGIGAATYLIKEIIGTYPYAGFIKEESLQTLSFGVKTALDNKDIEGAETAIQEQSELLNPSTWDKIIGAIPWANVQKQLKNFFDASSTKLEIDTKALENMKAGINNDFDIQGLLDLQTQKEEENLRQRLWQDMNRQEKERADQNMQQFWSDYLTQKQANAEQQQQFWANYQKDKELYWDEYQKRKEDSAPSKLGFGLL